jgi:hypothetical protein
MRLHNIKYQHDKPASPQYLSMPAPSVVEMTHPLLRGHWLDTGSAPRRLAGRGDQPEESPLPGARPPSGSERLAIGALALLLALHVPQTVASTDLDQVLEQIQKLKESYESRISNLEQEIKENRKQKN